MASLSLSLSLSAKPPSRPSPGPIASSSSPCFPPNFPVWFRPKPAASDLAALSLGTGGSLAGMRASGLLDASGIVVAALVTRVAPDWWREINESEWQDGIFYSLCAAYAFCPSSLWLMELEEGSGTEACDTLLEKVHLVENSEESERPEMVVGLYHSHPGFGCWLSGDDINTQQAKMSSRPGKSDELTLDLGVLVPFSLVLSAFGPSPVMPLLGPSL